MSDNIPFEIQSEIIKKLPVRSLIRCRSVSKAWKSLIDSSDFIAHYHTQMQHLLVTYQEPGDDKPNYISIADDHTFPHQQVSPPIPLLVNLLKHSIIDIIGCSHGLFCLHGVYPRTQKDIALLWNPSIRRAIAVVVPNVLYGMYETPIGFAVCPATNDPKILKITQISRQNEIETITSIPWQVEVFTLSTRVWRRPNNNLPRKSIAFDWLVRVVVNGFLYWLASDRIRTDGGYSSYHLIISFDITTEEFTEVNLPRSLAHESRPNLSMSKLRESPVVLQCCVAVNNSNTFVWMMEDGVPKLFTKLFTINVIAPDARINIPSVRVSGFRKSGEPIIQISEGDIPIFTLLVYEPCSKCISYLGIDGIACGFLVYPYMETLLLLDQPNVAAYNEMEAIRFLDDLVS